MHHLFRPITTGIIIISIIILVLILAHASFKKPTLWSQILKPIFACNESHTHALSRDIKYLRLEGQVCFYRRLFSDAVKPRGYISWPVWPLGLVNKTAWSAKLILTVDLAYPVGCASLGHLLMTQHCCLCLNTCFGPPMLLTCPQLPTHPPARPPL